MEDYSNFWPKNEKSIILPSFGSIDFETKIKRSKVYKLYDKFAWKYAFLRDMKQVNQKFGIREIMADIFLKETKIENFRRWQDFPKRAANEFFGINFPEQVPNTALREVIADGMYFSFEDFVPLPGMVIADVGAQYGDYSLMCSRVFSAKKVLSFEPLPEVFSLFKEAIEINDIENVQPFNCAVSSEDSTMKVYSDGNMARKNGAKEYQVKTMKLDSVIKEKIDILKIDVEGFEVDVLNGAMEILDDYHPKIIVETHSNSLKKETIKLLSRFGYSVIHKGSANYSTTMGMDMVRNLYLE